MPINFKSVDTWCLIEWSEKWSMFHIKYSCVDWSFVVFIYLPTMSKTNIPTTRGQTEYREPVICFTESLLVPSWLKAAKYEPPTFITNVWPQLDKPLNGFSCNLTLGNSSPVYRHTPVLLIIAQEQGKLHTKTYVCCGAHLSCYLF